MKEPQLDTVAIIDPPLQELRKNSSFKRSCLGTVGGLLIISVGLALAVRLAIGPGPTKLTTTPTIVRDLFPLYDTDHIDTITQISEQNQLDRDTLKQFFTSLLHNLDPDTTAPGTPPNLASKKSYELFQIQWNNLAIDEDFILNYYQTELQKKHYSLTTTKNSEAQIITFARSLASDTITGSVRIHFSPATSKTQIVLKIFIPSTLVLSAKP